ncbi:MAG: hypothetical protein ACE5GS_12630, partial [Kiloniellaceae bacterium]
MGWNLGSPDPAVSVAFDNRPAGAPSFLSGKGKNEACLASDLHGRSCRGARQFTVIGLSKRLKGTSKNVALWPDSGRIC